MRRQGAWREGAEGAGPRQEVRGRGAPAPGLRLCSPAALPAGGGSELPLGLWVWARRAKSSPVPFPRGLSGARGPPPGRPADHFIAGPAKPRPASASLHQLCCTGKEAPEAKRHPVSQHRRRPRGRVDFPRRGPNQSSGLRFPAKAKQKIWNPSAVRADGGARPSQRREPRGAM